MRWMPTLTLCAGLALLSGIALFSAGLSRTPPWLNAMFLMSAAGILALGVRMAVRTLRQQTDRAIDDAEHASAAQRQPPTHP